MGKNEYAINEKVSVYGEGIATITDRMFSEVTNEDYYTIRLLNGKTPKKPFYKDSEIEKISFDNKPRVEYKAEAIEEDGAVIIKVTRIEGGKVEQVAFNHAHRMHEDGLIGFLQALNYASKRMYDHHLRNEKYGTKENRNYGYNKYSK